MKSTSSRCSHRMATPTLSFAPSSPSRAVERSSTPSTNASACARSLSTASRHRHMSRYGLRLSTEACTASARKTAADMPMVRRARSAPWTPMPQPPMSTESAASAAPAAERTAHARGAVITRTSRHLLLDPSELSNSGPRLATYPEPGTRSTHSPSRASLSSPSNDALSPRTAPAHVARSIHPVDTTTPRTNAPPRALTCNSRVLSAAAAAPRRASSSSSSDKADSCGRPCVSTRGRVVSFHLA
mmetsp:Transcript_12124/g.41999  ORF Transcript_12124/g.41999 Transcript_12124/m.41999 type:complete len:244 (+) Transcript_12124:389-1120(+)